MLDTARKLEDLRQSLANYNRIVMSGEFISRRTEQRMRDLVEQIKQLEADL